MGFEEEYFSWTSEEAFRRVAELVHLDGKAADGSLLQAGKIQRHDFSGGPPIQFGSIHPRTANGQVHLAPSALGEQPYVYRPMHEPDYPLALITPASSRMTNSTSGEWSYSTLDLTIHPDDAAARRIRGGDTVRAFNRQGEVHCCARVSDSTRVGVVSMPKGVWMKASRNGRTGTALCPPSVDNVGGGACFNDARVEVERLESAG
jgi:anaerobic selenocysteine-containing dehydrogenase